MSTYTNNRETIHQGLVGSLVPAPVNPVFPKPNGPPVPILNMAHAPGLKNGTATLRIDGHPVSVAGSRFESIAATPDRLLGIAGVSSTVVGGAAEPITYSADTKFEGRPSVRAFDATKSNAKVFDPGWATRLALELLPGPMGDIAAKVLEKLPGALEGQLKALGQSLTDPGILIGPALKAASMVIPPLGAVVNGVAAAQMAVEMAQLAEEIQALMAPPLTPEKIDEIADIIANGVAAAAIGFVLGRIVKAARRKPAAVAARGDNKVQPNAPGTIQGGVSAASPPGGANCELGSCQPVIFATGVKVLAQTDFALPGPLPLEWRRFYRSSDRRPGWMGRGWSSPLAVELALTHGATLYYDERGRTVTLPELAAGERHFDARERLSLAHHTDGRWSIAFADGLQQHFAAPAAGQWRLPLLRQQDANGNAIVLHYPAYRDVGHDGIAPRPLGFTDSAGRRIDFVWQEPQQPPPQHQQPAGPARAPHPLLLEIRLLPRMLEGVPQPAAVLARYTYDSAGNLQEDPHADLASASDAAGGTARYRYRNHLMVAYTTKEGFTHHQQWSREDAGGRVVRTWCDLPGVLDTRFAYDSDARTTDVTDALGRTVRYHYDRHHEVTAIEEAGPDGTLVRTETTMDSGGRPREVRDALGRTVRYRFDSRGNLTSVADPTGATTRFVYGSGGSDSGNPLPHLPVEIVDALGSRWRTAYDEHGNPVTRTDPLGHATHTAYDHRGLAVAITDALGKTRTLLWDAAGQLITRTDCSGQSSHYEWDALGHLAAAIDALGQTTRLVHDPLGRLLEVHQPDGATQRYDWDADGNLLAYTDAQGATTGYRYDGLGQPVERTDAHGKTLRYDYDAVGRLTRLTNEVGAHYHFVYDSADNLVQESGFDGRTQRYAYNAAGELVAHDLAPDFQSA